MVYSVRGLHFKSLNEGNLAIASPEQRSSAVRESCHLSQRPVPDCLEEPMLMPLPVWATGTVRLRDLIYEHPIMPDCLFRHHAQESVRVIFSHLVFLSDASDNGRISVDRSSFVNPNTSTSYSTRTVDKALAWLISHKLMMKTASGVGRGHHSQYLIRWGFTDKTLSARQKRLNHLPNKVRTWKQGTNPVPTGNSTPPLEETLIEPGSETSFGMNDKLEILKSSLHETKNAPSFIWESSTPNIDPIQSIQRAMKHIRPIIEALPDPIDSTHDTLADGFAWAITRAIRSGHIRTGGELANLVNLSIDSIQSIDGVPEQDSRCFSFAGMVVRDAIHGKPTLTPQRWQKPTTNQRDAHGRSAEFYENAVNGRTGKTAQPTSASREVVIPSGEEGRVLVAASFLSASDAGRDTANHHGNSSTAMRAEALAALG